MATVQSTRAGARLWVVLGITITGLLGACEDEMTATPSSVQSASCTALIGQTFAAATVTSAITVAASATVGEYCRVLASITNHPGFEMQVNLPTSWNGKLLYSGGGGWDGVLSLVPDSSTSSYVTVASNGGHTSGSGFDASFALNNITAQNDFGFASAHTTLGVAKALVRKHYGADPTRSYFQGCSNGGREALIQASRYPADYDGIVAFAPAYSFTELFQAFIHNQQALNAPGASINATKAAVIANAVVAKCDTFDGLADGIVSSQACNFDPGTLKCSAGDNNSCLTDAQVTSARTIYGQTNNSAGQSIYPGWDAGGEDQGWPIWVTNPPADPKIALQYVFADGLIKYWLTGNPTFDLLSFNAANYSQQLSSAAATLDASPNLATFLASGRKLVLVHGTHDWAVSYKGSVQYFNQVAAVSGGAGLRDAGMALFLLPGVQHCGGGVGADVVDALDAVTQWVENGRPPSTRGLSAYKFDTAGKQLELTRPLCRYPAFAKYTGSGDPKQASSFTCAAP